MYRLTKQSEDPNDFQVFCHGDPFTNNVLYTHDENKNPTDIIFIDYQVVFWSSPCYDLIYFFAASTEPDLKQTAFDDLILCYHEELVKNLKKLNYSKKIPSLRDLYIDILKRGFIGAPLAFKALPFMFLAPREDANIDNIVADAGDIRNAMFNSPVYVRQLEEWFKFLEKKGLLDIE